MKNHRGRTSPQPGGHSWAPRTKPRRIRATYTRPHGVRHLIAAYDVRDRQALRARQEAQERVEAPPTARIVRPTFWLPIICA
jgi:hypothetical protein